MIEAKSAGRLSGAAVLSIELVSLKLPHEGQLQDISIVTKPLSSKNKGNGNGNGTAAKTAGGAVIGAVAGADAPQVSMSRVAGPSASKPAH